MAYPENAMPEHNHQDMVQHPVSQWGKDLSDPQIFENGVKLMRWFAKPFVED